MGSPGRKSKGRRSDALAKVPEGDGAMMEAIRKLTGLEGTDYYALVLCRAHGLPDPEWLPKGLRVPVVDEQLDMIAALLQDADQPVAADASASFNDTEPEDAAAVPAILHPDFAAARLRRGDDRSMTERKGA